jgi:hypothetical protein
VTLSVELSDVVRLQLDELVAAVTRRLAEWGHSCKPALAAPCMS